MTSAINSPSGQQELGDLTGGLDPTTDPGLDETDPMTLAESIPRPDGSIERTTTPTEIERLADAVPRL